MLPEFIEIAAVIYLTIGILILLLGVLIFRENPNRRINRVTGIMMFLAALAPIMGAFGLLIKNVSAASEVDLSILNRIYLIWEFFFPQLLLFSLIFPKENRFIRTHPKITLLIFLPHFLHFIIALLFRSPESIMSLIAYAESQLTTVLQPLLIIVNLAISLLSSFYEFHSGIFAFINLLYVLLAIFIMHQGYREFESPLQRKQIGLVLWGIRVSVGLYAITFLLPKVTPLHVGEGLNYLLTILALIIGPGSIALAIIKHQFLDIRLIIRRGIIFSVISGLLVGIYLLIYGQAKRLVNVVFGIDLPIVEILFLILAMIFFQPILSSIEETIEKFFIGGRSKSRDILNTLSHEILHLIDIDALKNKIVNTLSEELQLENVKILLKSKQNRLILDCKRGESVDYMEIPGSSDFISVMGAIDDPVKSNDIYPRISDENELSKIRELKATIFIPLKHHQELSGVLCIGKKLSGSKFTTEDITMFKLLADQMAIALENIELYEEKLEKQRIDEEISVSREIQRMLLPHHIPQGRNFEISAINISSKEVGGDYYDFIETGSHFVGISIGDISGKGIPGAILMSNLQATFRATAPYSTSPAEVMTRVNNQITSTTSSEKFATFFYGVLDSDTLTFTYANAGHNFPILRKSTGETHFLKKSDLVIGIVKDTAYQDSRIHFEPGDVLVLYTDGITEAINLTNDEFGEQHLIEIINNTILNSAEELRNRIYESVQQFTTGRSQYDDMTLIVLRIMG
ncbi:SpoIIE family protein phosphatase [candidate division KSB1 bacterium]|nr:SpoIIE family protein phosphatase [candidate division KSB1 bacterium]